MKDSWKRYNSKTTIDITDVYSQPLLNSYLRCAV